MDNALQNMVSSPPFFLGMKSTSCASTLYWHLFLNSPRWIGTVGLRSNQELGAEHLNSDVQPIPEQTKYVPERL